MLPFPSFEALDTLAPPLGLPLPTLNVVPSSAPSPSKKVRAKVAPEDPPGKKYPYVTGHCNNGAHEGTKKFSWKDTLMQSCQGRYEWRFCVAVCTCWCHELAATVRAMGDAPASVVTGTPDAVAPASVDMVGLAMPFPVAVVMPAEPPEIVMYRRLIESEKVSSQLINMVRIQILGEERTVVERSAKIGGRRHRGELDANVEIVCKLWLDKKLPWELLTTDAISMLIDADDPPSQGAVYAVLNRWADRGIAMVGTKPMRFMGFNEMVLAIGVAAALAKSSREAEKRAKGFF